MLILEDGSRIIGSTLKSLPSSKELLDYRFGDYGDARLHLWEGDESDECGNMIFLSISLPGFVDLKQLGLLAHLKEFFGPEVMEERIESGYDFTLKINKSKLTDEMIGKLSLLRSKCLALPLELAMGAQGREETTSMMRVPLRGGSDVMYIQGSSDRVTVILSTKFDDPSDAVLGRVFLQEFYEMRRQPHLQNTPSVLFGKEPPKEIKSLIPPNVGEDINYITFVLFPTHYAGAKRVKCISMIINFRDYFHYHIKACKAFLHNRMRAKVAEFLKMLNRTKPLLTSSNPTLPQ